MEPCAISLRSIVSIANTRGITQVYGDIIIAKYKIIAFSYASVLRKLPREIINYNNKDDLQSHCRIQGYQRSSLIFHCPLIFTPRVSLISIVNITPIAKTAVQSQKALW